MDEEYVVNEAKKLTESMRVKVLRVVKVGNDERPAGPKDIVDIQEQLSQVSNQPDLPFVTHHAIDVNEIEVPPNCKLVVEVGNDQRPAGPEDTASMKKLIQQSIDDNLILVTHHAIDIFVLPNKFFDIKIETRNI